MKFDLLRDRRLVTEEERQKIYVIIVLFNYLETDFKEKSWKYI